jgi:hypothetical protein
MFIERRVITISSDSPQSLGGSIPPDGGFKIAADLVSDAFDSPLLIHSLIMKDSVQAPYIGEDGRLTLFRRKFREPATLNPADLSEIDATFRRMARNSSGSGASVPQETLRFLPSISRSLIRQYYLQLVIPVLMSYLRIRW